MSGTLVGAKRRWAASAAGALIIVAVGLLSLRVASVQRPAIVPAPIAAQRSPVMIERPDAAGKVLNEETIMRDPMPLFLPTERNVTFPPPRRPEAGRTMLDLDDKRYAFGEQELKLQLPPAQSVPESAVALLQSDSAVTPLVGFGRTDLDVKAFPARGARVEILAGGTNQRVLAETLPLEAKPPSDRPWRPLEFRVRIDAAGLVGPLLITQRSDVEEVDKFFENYLVQRFRIGERLPPGFYRILVGP